jgi:hypothetical protein
MRQQSECSAERVQRRAIAGPVVGENGLDRDPVAAVEGDGPAQKGGGRRRSLVT